MLWHFQLRALDVADFKESSNMTRPKFLDITVKGTLSSMIANV